MDIYELTRNVATQSNIGDFTIYDGSDPGHPINPNRPAVYLTLGKIEEGMLPCDNRSFSWLDFDYDPENNAISMSWISIVPELRGGNLWRKLFDVPEEVGRQAGATKYRVVSVINEKLKRVLPRYGFTYNSEKRYFEKDIT